MPIKKYRVDTDKGSYVVEVDEPGPIPASEQTPLPTYGQDVAQFGLRELQGAGRTALGMVDPRNYYALGKDVLTEGPNVAGVHIVQGLLDQINRMAHGDPEAIGSGLMQVVAAKAVPEIPDAARKLRGPAANVLRFTGGAMESPLAGAIEPRLPHLGKIIKAAGDTLQPAAAAVPPDSGIDAIGQVIRASNGKAQGATAINAARLVQQGTDPSDALARVMVKPVATSEAVVQTRPAASAGQMNAPAKPTPPVVSETAVAAKPAAPAGTVGSGLSPKAQIDAAIESAGVKVNGRQMADLFEKVRDAKMPADQALREVLGTSAAGGRSLTAIYKAASDQGLTLTAHELDTAQSLTAQMSPAEAVQKVAEMRGFTDKFNLPKPETVEANKYFPKMGNPGYRAKMPTKPKGYIPK